MPRGEVGWPAFHRGNVPTDTAPVEEEQVGSDVFLLGWHLGQSFLVGRSLLKNNPQIPYGTTGVASSFETMETTEGVV